MIGDESDGTVIPQDLGLNWALSKKKSDYMGKRAHERSHMTDPERWKLVGLLTLDGSVIPDGAYAVSEGRNANGQGNVEGRVTSTYHSPTLQRGIAMGLITDGKRHAVLSDILGDEDHLGDMDFKVAGTRDGITALQLDIKVKGITVDIMKQALVQAREGRLHILGCMDEALTEARGDLSPHAPRIVVIHVNTEKIKDVIGPGGKNIRKIIEETQTTIDIQDDGSINIGSPDGERTERAIKMIRDLTAEAEVGKIYQGTVRSIKDFGCFVEIFPGTDGLVHISEICSARIDRNDIAKYMPEGEIVPVKVLAVDQSGRIKLSRKAALLDEKRSKKTEEKSE